jgi:acyl-CoA thioesterase
VTYLKPASQGVNTAKGWIVRMGKSVAFLEADLHNAKGELIAKASSTARLVLKSKLMSTRGA